MASLGAHIFDLPSDILFEILKRLDTKSIQNLSLTCKYLQERVDEFSDVFKELMAIKAASERAKPAGYSSDEDEDDYASWNEDGFSQDEDDLFFREEDRYSMGSNLDEELDELLHDLHA